MNSAKETTPFMPEKRSELEHRIFNLISSKEFVFNMDIGKLAVSVCAKFNSRTDSKLLTGRDQQPQLAVEVSQELWQLTFPRTRFLYELMETADEEQLFSGTPPESLPPDVTWAIFEAMISEGLGLLESHLELPVQIVAPVKDPLFKTLDLSFEILFPDDTAFQKPVKGTLHIPVTEQSASILEKALSTFPPKRSDPSLRLSLEKKIFLEAGTLAMPLGALKTVEKGDILIPDSWYLKNKRVVLRASPHSFLCEYDDVKGSVIIKDINVFGAGETMENSDNLSEGNASEESRDFDEKDPEGLKDTDSLELDLVFEVGRSVMTIDKIEQLSVGSIISLPQKLDPGVLVDIKINNQKIAQGKLVDIGEQLGIQITKTAAE